MDRSTTYPPPILPSIHTFAAATSQTNAWDNSDAYQSLDPTNEKAHDPSIVYASTPYQHQSIQLTSSNSQSGQQHQQQQSHSGYAPPYSSPSISVGASANFNSSTAIGTQSNTSVINNGPDKSASINTPLTTSYPPMSSPRLAYTRTLVGPLSANACRLQDEHRKPGIFFLFQDLSVRTEGVLSNHMCINSADQDFFSYRFKVLSD